MPHSIFYKEITPMKDKLIEILADYKNVDPSEAKIIKIRLIGIEKVEIVVSYKLYKFFLDLIFSELGKIH